MTSPSISSTSRMTPCAAGCCGPKFSEKLRIAAGPASSPPGSPAGGGSAVPPLVLPSLMLRSSMPWRSCPGPLRSAGRGVTRRGAGLLVAGQYLVHALPGRQEVEIAEFLLQPHRFVDDALLLV